MPLAWSLVLIFSVLLSISKWSGADAVGIVQKPAIILVPAAFSEPSVYDRVKASLSDVGYEVFTVKLPSVGKGSGHVDRTPDIKAVQKTLDQRFHLGRQVILVGNSYGGTVICDAVKDFEKESSVKSRDGKILGLIFVSIHPVSAFTFHYLGDIELSLALLAPTQRVTH
jgi:pimeloyl-ACP methyl ester carboxylesterase